MGNLTLKTTITINASAQKVWRALTDAAIVKQYFFGTDQQSDWKKGSPIIWTGEWEGKTYQDKGTIIDITPGQFLKYSYWSSMGGKEDKPENYQYVSYDLKEKDGITTFELTQDNIKDEAAKEHSEQNWQSIYGEMKKMIESGKV